MTTKLQIVYNSDRVHVSENGTPISTHVWAFGKTKDECIKDAEIDLQAYYEKLKSEGIKVEVLPAKTIE